MQSSLIVEKSSVWKDYELLDSGKSQRLERYGDYIISRPDPQAIWQPRLSYQIWNRSHARFEKQIDGKERWSKKSSIPEKWKVTYNGLQFWARLTPFKHTGIFPEQSAQWDWMEKRINNYELSIKNENIRVLNLFGYTGIASLVCARAGAQVTHIDASKPAISWARENQILSGLDTKPIRWILDDALKFCKREIKRGKTYHGIIMDPPVYGHGPKGERWDFQEHFPELLSICRQILDKEAIFLIVNAYAISSSAFMLQNIMQDQFGKQTGEIESGELVLQEKNDGRILSTGIFSRWSRV